MRIIDYDKIEEWSPWFTEIMAELTAADLIDRLKRSQPEYMEDALNFVEKEVGSKKLLGHLNKHLLPYFLRVYHGTRITEEEDARIKSEGLKSLILADRKSALVAIFSQHPNWLEKEAILDDALIRFGPDWNANGSGKREDGKVHVCLSRTGLLKGCSHYLTHGAEVDQHIAREVFPDGTGLTLLTKSRAAKLVSFISPFNVAAKAANPFGFPNGEMPGLLRRLFAAWAYKLVKPEFEVEKLGDGSALMFDAPIAAERIERIESVNDMDIKWSR